MNIRRLILILIALTVAEEVVGSPLKFPDETSVGRAEEGSSGENIEGRFHHNRKKKRKKHGCGNNRFKRADSQGRFFFPILNYYDTNVYINNGEGCGSGGGSEIGSGLGGGVGGLGSGLGGGLGNIGSGLGGGLGSLGSGLGGGLGNIGSGLGGGLGSLGSGFPSIGSGIPPLGGSPSSPTRPPIQLPTYTTQPPVLSPTRPPAPVSVPDPDNEDYDYSDFSTTTRYRPNNLLSDYPVINSLSNSIRPVIQRPQRVFNQYVVRPINKTIREFYSLF